jgi:radical SAM superfamily enzyme YgiQ (UPF0313 family)
LPLGALCVVTALRKESFPVDFLDVDGLRLSKEEVLRAIRGCKPKVVGLSALATLYNYVAWISEEIKKIDPAITIVLGGTLASSSYSFVLRTTRVDICVLGEGEVTAPELMRCLESGGMLEKVHGIAYTRDGEVCTTPQRALIEDLDTVAELDLSMVDFSRYIRPGTIIASRGCSNRCLYCYQQFKGVRTRSPESLYREISLLKNKYGVKFFTFLDSYLMSEKAFIERLCSLLKPLRIQWDCYGRLDKVNKELLAVMRDAGCIRINYGIESLHQKILDAMNKRITVEEIEKNLTVSMRSGIKEICGSFIIGYFKETEETLAHTIQEAKRWKIYAAGFYLTPFPGTYVYDEAFKKKLIASEHEYFTRHLGRGDEFESISNKFYINCSEMSDEALTKGYARFEKELLRTPSFPARVKHYIAGKFAKGKKYLKEALIDVVEE